MHAAVDTLGEWLALSVTAANEDERTPVAALTAQVQEVTGESVEVAFVDQGSTGPRAGAGGHAAPPSLALAARARSAGAGVARVAQRGGVRWHAWWTRE